MYTKGKESTDRRPSVEEYIARLRTLNKEQSWPRAWAQRVATAALRPRELRRAQKLLRKQPLRLHIGCGDTYMDGWVNIDLARPGKRRDLRLDLRRGLPFADGAAEAIFSEHFFEHLGLAGASRLLKECKRVLVPGGVLRVSVPDLERYVHSYLGSDELIDEYRPGRPSRALAFAEIFFFHGHRSTYDFETLELVIREVGFSDVERSVFGGGKLTPSPDSKYRQRESLYVEATK